MNQRLSFASTLTQEQLPFIITKLADYNVRRMVEQHGAKGALEIIVSDEKQQKIFERIINEEFNHMPLLTDFRAGIWIRFTESNRYRHVIGQIKSVGKAALKVTEYADTGGKAGWAPTGQEWAVVFDLISDVQVVEPKMTVEQVEAERIEVEKAEKAAAAKATPEAKVVEAKPTEVKEAA